MHFFDFRTFCSGAEGREFESRRVRHFFTSKVKFLVKLQKIIFPLFFHRIALLSPRITLLSHRK